MADGVGGSAGVADLDRQPERDGDELPAAKRTAATLRALERDVARNEDDAAIDSAAAETRLRAPVTSAWLAVFRRGVRRSRASNRSGTP